MRHAALVGLVLAAVAAPAAAAQTPVGLQVAFSTDRPAAPTTLAFTLTYGTPGAKPPGVDRVELRLPAGTLLRTDLPGACDASDAQLLAAGPSACPNGSRLGAGTFVAATGVPLADPFEGELELFRTPTGIVEVVRPRGGGPTLGTDRFTVEGSTLVAAPPPLPGGPPDGRLGFRSLSDTILDRSFVTTPAACPPGGWAATVDASFADGSTGSAAATLPCAVPAAPAVTVTPSTLVVGRRARVRVVVAAGTPRCRAGATVRVAGARARTGPRGRAVLRVRPRRVGLRTVAVTKPGCPPQRARVSVVSAR